MKRHLDRPRQLPFNSGFLPDDLCLKDSGECHQWVSPLGSTHRDRMGAGRGFLATLRVFAARQNCVSVGTPSGGSATARLLSGYGAQHLPTAGSRQTQGAGAGAGADTAVTSAPKGTEPERVHARTRTLTFKNAQPESPE